MAVSTPLLSEEHDDILGYFANSEYITISVPDETDSKKYEVEYKIQGAVRQEDGSVVVCRGHKVSISIPFGYPNFSPNCKPLTSIFHPDFDPDAICINDFWQESHALCDLVIHIGLMISGREFSTENTFNPEAAAWYEANPKKIPFETVDLQRSNIDEAPSDESAVLEEITLADDTVESYTELTEQYEVDLSKAKRKKRVLILTLSVGIVIFAVGYFLMMDIQNYKSSLSKWREAPQLLEEKRYQELESNGRNILARLEQVKFINRAGRDSLVGEIKQQLNTPEVKAGLSGKILFEGDYRPKKTVAAIIDLRRFMEDGDAAFQGERWGDASISYKKALDLLKLHQGIEIEKVGLLELSFARAEINKNFQAGRKLFAEKKIADAVASFQKAAEIADNYKVGPTEISAIHVELDKALVEKFVLDGDRAFTANDLVTALENFNKALPLAEKEGVADAEYVARIRRSISQVNLYKFLSKGKNAYESGAWKEALDAFQEALLVLSRSSLGGVEKQVNERAIREKILQTKLKGLDVLVLQSKRQQNFPKALELAKEIVRVINSSSLKGVDEFKEKILLTKVEIKHFAAVIDRQEKTKYLRLNYQKIFHDNHFLARSATLSSPLISFVAERGDIQEFKLKCTGLTATGRISLELNYQYDRQKKMWRVGKLAK